HHARIAAFLAQVEDCDEWAVKGLLDRKVAVEYLAKAALAAQATELAALAPGIRYLREQRARQAAARELTGWLRVQQERLHDQIGVHTRARRDRSISPALAPDESRELAWNWALLIPRLVGDAFQQQLAHAAQTLAPRGLTLNLSGPWPPYSFCPPLTGAAEP
ncbi:MAG: GvpL/GvpF family gas vesicle protein, partial [Candidatus Contendobacter sp.]|nr:GvpL/GvpF family gas vesicle protein [Candidatus Contendobacter sp.]